MDKINVKSLSRHKHLLVLTFLAIIGFILTRVGPNSSPVTELLPAIGATIIVSSILGVIYEYYLRSEIIKMNDMSSDRVIQKFCLSKDVDKVGLDSVFENAAGEHFDDFLLHKKNITIVMNDGRTWFSQRNGKLAKRFSNKKFKTNVILIHPESDCLVSLGRKVGSTSEKLKEKILETHELLKDLSSQNNNLIVYGHKLPTTQSIFLCENYAFSVPYPIASKMEQIPMYKYRKNVDEGVYKGIEADVSALIKQSEEIYKA